MVITSQESKTKIGLFEIILLFFTGFIALSTYANVILDKIGFYLIEILLLPIIIYYVSQGKIQLTSKINFTPGQLILCVILVVSTILGIVNTGSIFSALTCIRPFIYILIILKYIKDHNCIIDINKLYILSLGCVAGDYIYTINYSTIAILRGYQHINILAVATVILVPLIKNKKILSIISIAIALYISLLSGYRINLLACIVVIFSYAAFKTIFVNSIKKRIAALLLIAVLTFLFVWIVNNFGAVASFLSDLLNMNSETYSRVFGRIQLLLDKDMTVGDQSRLEGFTEPFVYFFDYIIPSGPIGKMTAHRFGQYTDIPIMFFYDIFGSIGAWIFVIICLVYTLNKISSIKTKILTESITDYEELFVILMPLMITLFIINGTFLTFINISILTALCIGGLVIDSERDDF